MWSRLTYAGHVERMGDEKWQEQMPRSCNGDCIERKEWEQNGEKEQQIEGIVHCDERKVR